MEAKDVTRPGDILMVADTMLHAKALPTLPPDPATPPAPAGDDAAPQPEGAPAPADAPAPEGDAPAADAAEAALSDPLLTRAQALAASEAAFEERKRLADESFARVLKDPKEYERTRRELGLAEPEPAAPVVPEGPDPFGNPDAWRYQRTQAYQRHGKRSGQAFTLAQINEAVERDLVEARTTAYQDQITALNRRLDERDRRDGELTAAARTRLEADASEKALQPFLTAHFPKGVSPEQREDVDAHVALARAKGQKPDYAAIVAKVSGRPKAVISTYIGQKKAQAAGTQPTVSKGAGTPAPTSIIDRLPATLESIGKIGAMRAEGKIR